MKDKSELRTPFSITKPWILGMLVASLAVTTGPAEARAPQSFADIVEKAKPAVVNIATTKTVEARRMPFPGLPGGPGGPRGGPGDPPRGEEFFEEFFERFFPGQPREFKTRSLGSGFFIDQQGTIVTNHHVVAQADEVVIRLAGSDRQYEAEILGSDTETDLAVIRIDPDEIDPEQEISVLRFGDSEKLRVGEWVVAVGNPFGLSSTVTAGIVSATERVIGQGTYDNFIQTDASINPGNSGGPLLNTEGEVVGINTAIFSRTGGNIGIGFATPASLAKDVIEQLRAKGEVVRGWLGVVIQPVTEELAEAFELPERRGALVSDVEDGSPADRAGLKRGDVIVTYDGDRVPSSQALPAMVAKTSVGEAVEVEVVREGKRETLTVEVGKRPARLARRGVEEEPKPDKAKDELGIVAAPLTSDVAERLGVPPGSGVLVEAVAPGSPAQEGGLRRGDVITEVNRTAVQSVKELRDAIGEAGQTVLLLVRRGDQSFFVTVRKEEGE